MNGFEVLAFVRHLVLLVGSVLLVSACGGGGGGGGGDDSEPPNWAIVSSTTQSGVNLSAVEFGNGVFVALGHNGIGSNANLNGVASAVSISTDGSTWNAQLLDLSGFGGILQGLAFGEGRFVAVSSSGDIVASTDGVAWDRVVTDVQHLGSTVDLASVAYGDGVFVASGVGGVHLVSDDGLAWSEVRQGPGGVPIQFANGRFIAHAGSVVYVSTDRAETWSTIDMTALGVSLAGIAYGNGVYVATDELGRIATSPDLTTWTVRADLGGPVNQLQFVNGWFFMLSGNVIHASADGRDWDSFRIPTPAFDIYDVAYGNGRFIAVGAPGLTVRGTP